MAYVLLPLLFALFIGGGIASFSANRRNARDSVVCLGKVIVPSHGRIGGGEYSGNVRYGVRFSYAGQIFEKDALSSIGDSGLRVGQNIAVYYNPKRPNFVIRKRRWEKIDGYLFIACGIGTLIWMLWGL